MNDIIDAAVNTGMRIVDVVERKRMEALDTIKSMGDANTYRILSTRIWREQQIQDAAEMTTSETTSVVLGGK